MAKVSQNSIPQGKFPIRVIEELTGIPATTLRAWERRYGLLHPQRAPSGHRLYSPEDLTQVREVTRLLAANLPIREAARRVREGIRSPLIEEIENPWGPLRDRLIQAIAGFEEGGVDALYNEAISLYPMDRVAEQLLLPVLRALGERWQGRAGGIAEEHFFTAYLRNKLGARFHHESQRPRGRRLLAACLPGEFHELGLLLFLLAAMGRGYRVLYLGADLPLGQIPAVIERADVAAVVLSASRLNLVPTELEARWEGLWGLRQNLSVPLFIGGHFAEQYAEQIAQIGAQGLGAQILPALDRLESQLPAYGA